MGLLSDMFQQQQNIANNPTQAIRTPQQIAYDNLLNRQANIEQQNKNYQTFNGIMSGVGGLGKIIASSMVKDPMQQAGAMQGISEQEGRLDNLRQAYENARMSQNKDYVTQAQQQLALARDDEDKAYNRDLTAQQIAYKKAMDDLNFNYQKEQDKIKNKLEQDKLNWHIQNAKNENNLRAAQLKDQKAKDELEQQIKQENLTKLQRENSPEYLQQQFEQKQKEAEEKERQEQLKGYVSMAQDMFKKGEMSNEDLIAIQKNPELFENLIPDKKWLGFATSSKDVLLPEYVIKVDKYGKKAKVYKDGRIEEL